jgi:glyoxylase-like metal-dependent hydrolase (beta-lactamase superfamily II)
VITHLHEDHIGGLTYLPGSELLISRDEWDNRGWKLFGFLPMVYKGSLTPPGSVTPIDFTSRPCENFTTSLDLTSDGTVTLLPTPGHSLGTAPVISVSWSDSMATSC